MTRPRPRSLAILFVVATLFTLGAALAKLELQRTHKAAWMNANHEYQGFFSIDGYAHKAERIQRTLNGSTPGLGELAGDLGRDLHPTALAPLVLVALLAQLMGSIPWAFALLSAAAWLGLLAVARALARHAASEQDTDPTRLSEAGLVAAILVAGHMLSARTAGQLYMDGFCALVAALALWQLGPWLARQTTGRSAALVSTLTLGLFTKVSCLPLLALVPLACLLAPAPAFPRRRLLSGLAVAALPLVPWTLAMLAMPGSDALSESRHLWHSWGLDREHLVNFGRQMLLLLQFFPVLLLLRPRRPASWSARLAGALVVLLLLSTWAFRLPPIPRLYLPVLVPLAVWATPRLQERLAPGRLAAALWLWTAGNAALTLYGLGQIAAL